MKKIITVLSLSWVLAIHAQGPVSATCKLFGVNLAAGEFGSAPGTYGTNYTYPNADYEYKYFGDNKLGLVRLPFLWERVQAQAMGTLTSNDISKITNALDVAQSHGVKVILDMHNYARYHGTALVVADAPKLADVWQKLSAQFGSHPALYGYEIMNEPHDLPDGSAGWVTIAQAAVNAIRKSDNTHYILVPGYSWQSADRWPTESDGLKSITDPSDASKSKIIYSAHQYFDSDASGTYGSACSDVNIGVTRVNHFISWLTTNNAKGIITEFGIPDNSCWKTTLDNFMNVLNNSSNIIGGTYWAAGPWWGNYALSVEPNSDGTTNSHSQMSILLKYPSNTSACNTSPPPSSNSVIKPGCIAWGVNCHPGVGGYANISQVITDIQNVFGSTPNTVISRWGAGALDNASLTQLQNAGILVDEPVMQYPSWGTYGSASAAYNAGYSAMQSQINATPTCLVYEIGNEWSTGAIPQPSGSNQMNAQAWRTSGGTKYLEAVGVTAGCVAAFRDHAPAGAIVIYGASGGWTQEGFPLALAQDLINYNDGTSGHKTGDLRGDYVAVHWYNNAGGGNMMGSDPANFNGGMNVYTTLGTATHPIAWTEFGSEPAGSGTDAQAGANITQLMDNFVAHVNATGTEPGCAIGQIYQLYATGGEAYKLYNSPGSIAPEGTAVKNWITSHPCTSSNPGPSPNPTPLCTASQAPVIDGVAENFWNTLSADTLKHTLVGTVSSSADLFATYKATWDNTSLYLLVQVKDNILKNDSPNPWDDDAIEVFVDGNNDKATSYDANDRQFIFRWNDNTIYQYTPTQTNPTGVIFAQSNTSDGYLMEIKISWSALGVTASPGKLVGLDVQVDDDDDGGVKDKKISWTATTDQSYTNPSLFGTIKLNNTVCAITTGIANIANNASVSVYPNPFSSNFRLSIAADVSLSGVAMKIYDICGKEVKNVLISNHETIIEKGELKSGLYFYSIINSNEKIFNGKLIVE